MINYKYSLLLLICIALCGSACQKLEDRPFQNITEEYLWDTKDSLGTNASYFLNDIYSNLPDGYNRIGGDLLDAATDDAVPSADNTAISRFTNGGYSPLVNDDNAWSSNYNTIRKCNLFVQNFPKVNLKKSDPAIFIQGQYWKAENRFLRAMFYYELIKRYGGVPLLGDRVLTIDDDLRLPRNSFEECVAYIVSECDAIKDDLRPNNSLADVDYGRITKTIALTLKAKALVLAASPLNNAGNDLDKWRSAKNALADIIRSGAYELEPSFSSVFLVRKNKEVILAYQRALTFDVETNNAPVGYVNGTTTSRGRTSPTQELVDAFPTKKGLPISVDIKTTTNQTGYDANNPYANRDPRLYSTIFLNGGPLQWLGRDVETFNGGRDRPGGSVVQTKTGYYMRKFMADFSAQTAYSNQSHNFPIFRYADILLLFAEAKNEVDGPGTGSDSVYTYLRAIRARADINVGVAPNTYGIADGLSAAQMRELIRNDRRVELAFEEQRFWDLRRWKIAENVYNKPLHGMRITKTGTALSYQIEQLNTPFQFFAPRMYRYAIPYSEISKNRNLTQNEGYQ
jgi:hypothetical protein